MQNYRRCFIKDEVGRQDRSGSASEKRLLFGCRMLNVYWNRVLRVFEVMCRCCDACFISQYIHICFESKAH